MIHQFTFQIKIKSELSLEDYVEAPGDSAIGQIYRALDRIQKEEFPIELDDFWCSEMLEDVK